MAGGGSHVQASRPKAAGRSLWLRLLTPGHQPIWGFELIYRNALILLFCMVVSSCKSDDIRIVQLDCTKCDAWVNERGKECIKTYGQIAINTKKKTILFQMLEMPQGIITDVLSISGEGRDCTIVDAYNWQCSYVEERRDGKYIFRATMTEDAFTKSSGIMSHGGEFLSPSSLMCMAKY